MLLLGMSGLFSHGTDGSQNQATVAKKPKRAKDILPRRHRHVVHRGIGCAVPLTNVSSTTNNSRAALS